MWITYLKYFVGFLTLFGPKVSGSSEAVIAKLIDTETKPAGSEGRLNCTVTGVKGSGGSVRWYSLQPSARMISNGEKITIMNQVGSKGELKYRIFLTHMTADTQVYTLAIRRLTSTDSGNYECQIFLTGVDASKFPRATGKLVVQLPPSISDSDTTPLVQQIEGKDAVLTCDASGVPPPRISWSRANGRPLPNGKQTVYGTKLVLKNVTSSHAGLYRCKADNYVRPPATMDITLQVRTKPTAVAFRPTYGQKPEQSMALEMACIITGDPTPDLSWYRVLDSSTGTLSKIFTTHKYKIFKLVVYPGHNRRLADQWLTLRILEFGSLDIGKYMCEGRNQYGTGNTTITVYSTPTCQGPNCYFQSYDTVGASSISVSMLLFLVTMAFAVLMGTGRT